MAARRDLAAAINPTLRPTARALRHTVERWADEDAADAVADRRTVARALARAALAAHAHRRHTFGGDARSDRRRRTRSGRGTPRTAAPPDGPAPHWPRPPCRCCSSAATADASMHVQHAGERLFEHVMAGHHTTRTTDLAGRVTAATPMTTDRR